MQRADDEPRLRRCGVGVVRVRHRQLRRRGLHHRAADRAGRFAAAAAAVHRFRAGAPRRGASSRCGCARVGGCVGVGRGRMAVPETAGRHAGSWAVSLASAAPDCRCRRRGRHHLSADPRERSRGRSHRASPRWRARNGQAAGDGRVRGDRDGGLRQRAPVDAVGGAGKHRHTAACRYGAVEYRRLRRPAPRDGRVRSGPSRARHPLRDVARGGRKTSGRCAAVVGDRVSDHVR